MRIINVAAHRSRTYRLCQECSEGIFIGEYYIRMYAILDGYSTPLDGCFHPGCAELPIKKRCWAAIAKAGFRGYISDGTLKSISPNPHHGNRKATPRTINNRRKRVHRSKSRLRSLLMIRDNFICVKCGFPLDEYEPMEIHHIIPISLNKGNNHLSNLELLHADCHRQYHKHYDRLGGWRRNGNGKK